MTVRRDPDIARSLALFKGIDSGAHDLPQEVLAARRTLRTIEAERAAKNAAHLAIHPGSVQQAVIEGVLTSARSGNIEPGWVQPLLDIKDEQVRLGHEMAMLDQAEQRAAIALPTIVRSHSEEILAEFLRPPLEAIVEEARAIHRKVNLATVPFGREADLARSNKPVREAHVRVRELAAMYDFLRGQQAGLRSLVGAPSEEAFARFREFPDVYHVITGLGSWSAPAPPWESVPGDKLAWIAMNPQVEVWMPTADECEAANAEKVAAGGFLATKAAATGQHVPPSDFTLLPR